MSEDKDYFALKEEMLEKLSGSDLALVRDVVCPLIEAPVADDDDDDFDPAELAELAAVFAGIAKEYDVLCEAYLAHSMTMGVSAGLYDQKLNPTSDMEPETRAAHHAMTDSFRDLKKRLAKALEVMG